MAQTIKAQDPIFTQSFLMPETINTGFTGALESTKAGIIHRTQWAGLNFSINTQYAFVDTWLDAINSGIGISVLNHKETSTRYNFTQINFNYAYALQLSDTWYFRPSISVGGGSKDFGFQDLLLEDQIDILNNSINTTSMDPLALNKNVLFFDYSASLLFNTERSWIGVTVRHLNRPNISMTHAGSVPLGMFMSAHAAIEFPLSSYSGSYADESSIYVLGNFMQQNSYNRFDFGTQYVYNNLLIGVLAATNPVRAHAESHFVSSINVFAGMKWEGFKMSCSYDFSTSAIGKTGGVYELLLIYDFGSTGGARRLKCPRYF